MVGVLLDLDHFFDYFIHTGWNTDIKRFFEFSYQLKYTRLYVLLHAYEYMIIVALCLVFSHYHPLIIAAGIGYAHHLILDHLFNRVKPLAYFITYRARNRFSMQSFFKDGVLPVLPTD